MSTGDPMEALIDAALQVFGEPYVRDGEGETRGLDFYFTNKDVYLEVKQFHSDRIGEQMSRADDVIAIQGRKAAAFFTALLLAVAAKRG